MPSGIFDVAPSNATRRAERDLGGLGGARQGGMLTPLGWGLVERLEMEMERAFGFARAGPAELLAPPVSRSWLAGGTSTSSAKGYSQFL